MAYKADLLACVEELVGPENWEIWEESMRMLFRAASILDVVEGTRKEPIRQIDRAAYDVDCAKAQLYMTKALSQQNRRYILGCRTAKEMWDRLKRTFGMGTGQRLDKLLEKFFGYGYSEADMITHIGELHNLFNDINSELNRKSKAELDECILLGRILYILPPSYIPVKTVWETESENTRKL